MAISLGELGLPVAVNYCTDAAAAAEVVQRIRNAGGHAQAFAADCADKQAVDAMVEAIARDLGPVDVLVANAGIGMRADLFASTQEQWRRTMAVNAEGAFLCTQAVAGGMRERGFGRLVYLSSIAARVGGVISPAYAASKAAVEGLMHYCATHLLRHGITSNAVSPAFIETDMMRGAPMPPVEQMPLGRMGQPEEMGPVLEMILRSPYLTGQTIHLNAGRYQT